MDIPRRIRVDQMTPAELAIREAKRVVEEAGCDVRLTNAIVLLSQAQDAVADFVDGVERVPLVACQHSATITTPPTTIGAQPVTHCLACGLFL